MNSLTKYQTHLVVGFALLATIILGMAPRFGMAASILTADPTSLFNMGFVRIGSANPIGNNWEVTLTNVGDTDTNALNWSDGSHFSDISCDGQIVNSNGGEITIIINAKPSAFGTFTDTLQISYGGYSTLDIIVGANVPELWIYPGRHTFAATNVGQSDGPHTFTIYNDDNSAHELLTPFLTGGDSASFSVSDPAEHTLQSGEVTTFGVTFTPTTDDLLVNNITIITLNAKTLMTISVEGTGLVPICNGDFDTDGHVDGSDLSVFAADFGRTDCP